MSEAAYRDREFRLYPMMASEVVHIAASSVAAGAAAVMTGVVAAFASAGFPDLWVGVAMLACVSIGGAWSGFSAFNLVRDETVFENDTAEAETQANTDT